jgi:hypothetical protein
MFDTGYWVLVIGYWLLGTGYWLLVIGYWLLMNNAKYPTPKFKLTGSSVFDVGYLILDTLVG